MGYVARDRDARITEASKAREHNLNRDGSRTLADPSIPTFNPFYGFRSDETPAKA
jgi:hypothetical protein